MATAVIEPKDATTQESGAAIAAVVGTIIAGLLLVLYFFAWKFAVDIVFCVSTSGCAAPIATDWTTGYATALSTIGGLVSALAIAVLAATKPGKNPATQLSANVPGRTGAFVTAVTIAYLFVWMGTGVYAYFLGVMQHPDALSALTDLGQAWLGLAVAAGYAYFGISPRQE